MNNANSDHPVVLQGVILTRDLAASIAAYQRLLPVQPAAPSTLTRSQASAWLAPVLAGAPVVALCEPSGQPTIWLVEARSAGHSDPFRTAGWFGLHLEVAHLPSVAQGVADSPFESLTEADAERLCLRGHNDEVIFLSQSTQCGCEMLSAVANVPDIDAALAGYQTLSDSASLAGRKTLRHINRAWGFGGERKHPVADVVLDARHQLQLNELKAARIPASTEYFCGLFMVCTDNPLQPGTRVIKGSAGERLLSHH
ncbi:hypothetical protein [Simiduia agarivorans]|uniref:Uncharacterized protein n=1 Tax=Simiduia agarivorans (strain DSM 21679 / JCM 13881 / BCRC 17597 / SA1) TaxID=1117647 RepID=K4KII5_SIMAS|nr:hypothetical protein [Simiduia agarivorans]AFU98836.2 hypothetical protein M5M_08235 [Simiduia agarivorans SA1 = DSM 21679]